MRSPERRERIRCFGARQHARHTQRVSIQFVAVSAVAVSAVAGSVGALVAAGSLLVAVVAGRRESKRRRQEREERAIELASTVVVQSQTPDQTGVAKIAVSNVGERPVFNLRVRSDAGASLSSRSDGGDLGEAVPVLGRDAQVHFGFTCLPGLERSTLPIVEFTDARGRRWKRHGLDRPVAISPPEIKRQQDR